MTVEALVYAFHDRHMEVWLLEIASEWALETVNRNQEIMTVSVFSYRLTVIGLRLANHYAAQLHSIYRDMVDKINDK